MQTLFDPIGVFRVIANNPEIFGAIQGEMRKQAQMLLEKSLKTKQFSLDNLRKLRRELGEDEFELFVDAMSGTSVQKIAKKFDPNNQNLKLTEKHINVVWARNHIMKLSSGEIEPEEKLLSLDKILPAAKRSHDNLIRIYQELGPDRFAASLAQMSGSAPATFVKKIDPKNPRAKAKAANIDMDWARRRIAELASEGENVPADRAQSAEPPKRNLFDEAHRVFSTKRGASA